MVENIKNIADQYREKDLLIIGDFNAHLDCFDNKTDRIGKLLNELIDESNLIMGNGQVNYQGIKTRSRGDGRTTIDYVLYNDTVAKHIS